MKITVPVVIQSILLLFNFVQLSLVLTYFWGVVLTYDAYAGFTIAEYVAAFLAAFYLTLRYMDEPRSYAGQCEAVPCWMSGGYHVVAHIVISSIYSEFRITAIMTMVAMCIASINVLITYLRNA